MSARFVPRRECPKWARGIVQKIHDALTEGPVLLNVEHWDEEEGGLKEDPVLIQPDVKSVLGELDRLARQYDTHRFEFLGNSPAAT